jgi:hypothetical protein
MKKIAQLRERWSHRTVSAPARTAPQLPLTSPTPLLIPPSLDGTLDVAKQNIRPQSFQGVEASDEKSTTNALATPIPRDNTSDDVQDEWDFDDQGFQDEISHLPIEYAFDDRIIDGLCTRCRGLSFVSSEQQLEVLKVGHIATVSRLSIRDGCELCVQFHDMFRAICDSVSKTKLSSAESSVCGVIVLSIGKRKLRVETYISTSMRRVPVWTCAFFLRKARSLGFHHRSTELPVRSDLLEYMSVSSLKKLFTFASACS